MINPNEYSEHIYTEHDVEKAYTMGLETAAAVFEKSLGLSIKGQRLVLNRLKEHIVEDKVKSVMGR